MRRHRAEPRVIPPDPKYGSVELARFINKVMLTELNAEFKPVSGTKVYILKTT